MTGVSRLADDSQLFKNNNPYDPTLRLGFILSQNKGKISVTLINAFWKFPPQPLNSNGSIQEKHVTKPMVGTHDPAMNTDQYDTNKIYEILYNMLPKLYEKIIT